MLFRSEYGWSVSYPVWHETCKDVNEAVVKYGKLFVLKAILAGKEISRLKIELKKKKLIIKDEIARLHKLQWDLDHEHIGYGDDR